MERNKLDDLFRNKMGEASFHPTEDDWNEAAGLLQLSKKTVWTKKLLGLLSMTFLIIMIGVLSYLSFGRDLGHFQLQCGENSDESALQNEAISELEKPEQEAAETIVLGSSNDRESSPSSRNSKSNTGYQHSIESKGYVYRDNLILDDQDNLQVVVEDAILPSLDNDNESVETELSPDYYSIVETIDRLDASSLASENLILYPKIQDSRHRKRQWMYAELIAGTTRQDHHVTPLLFISLVKFHRLSLDVGVGVHYRRFNDMVVASASFPTYDFGSSHQDMTMYTDQWIQMQIPMRLAYQMSQKSRLELTGSLLRHLNSRGSIKSSWQEWQPERINIVDNYFNLWSVAGQIHYTYDLSSFRIGGGVRLDNIMLNTDPESFGRDRQLPVALEFKISKSL